MAFYDYRIGAGWNVALASLVNIENITPSGEPRFKAPASYGTFDPGIFRIRGDGTVYQAGYGYCEWPYPGITYGQVRYLMTTYANSGYSGKVTIYTKTDNPAVYARYNAVMILPKLRETGRRGFAIPNYVIRMTRLVAL